MLRQELTDRYEDVAFNDDGLKLDREVLVEFLAGRHKAIIGLERIDGDLLERLPDLEVVSKYGVGTDMLDLSEMRRRGIRRRTHRPVGHPAAQLPRWRPES